MPRGLRDSVSTDYHPSALHAQVSSKPVTAINKKFTAMYFFGIFCIIDQLDQLTPDFHMAMLKPAFQTLNKIKHKSDLKKENETSFQEYCSKDINNSLLCIAKSFM